MIQNYLKVKQSVPSDHSLISHTIEDRVEIIQLNTRIRYNDKKIDGPTFQATVAAKLRTAPTLQQSNDNKLHHRAEQLTNAISEACVQVLPKSRKRKPTFPPWWNEQVNLSRQEVARTKRLILRSGLVEDRNLFKAARNRHVSNIRKAKKDNWVKFVQDQAPRTKPWGKLTKWLINGKRETTTPSVLRKRDGEYTGGIPDTVAFLLNELIPNSPDDQIPTATTGIPDGGRSMGIDLDELKQIVWRQKNRAPGEDGITAKIIKAAWPVIGTKMLRILNGCLARRIFPNCWKSAVVVVILKNKSKDPLLPKSYRPVSLLSVLGKIYEEVICNLLEANIGHNLSPNQHGFRPAKSTTTALNELQNWLYNTDGKYIIGSFLDISGAFDNVRWPQLASDMQAIGCDQALTETAIGYLTNRTATYTIGSVSKTIQLTRGCPQGSKFGPRLWNITMDPLLKSINRPDAHIIAYADDIALLVTGNTRKTVLSVTEELLEVVSRWAQDRGLSFSEEKSVMVPLKGGLVPGFTAKMGTGRIKSVTETKYLGLHLGQDFSFDGHAIKLTDSSTDMFSRLRQIRKSKWGTSSDLAMLLYKTVYLPRVTYGAITWYPRLKAKNRIKKKLVSAQRRTLLAATGAYKTVSTMALQAVAGAPPINLQIQIKIDMENGMSKSEAVDKCIRDWQNSWEAENAKGRWTFSFIPDIAERMATPISFGHYICQLITGHGDINHKLHGFNLVESLTCDCGHPEETAKHILEECPLASLHRTKLKETMARLGYPWPCNNNSFIKHRSSWTALQTFATEYFTEKEVRRAEEGIQHLHQQRQQ